MKLNLFLKDGTLCDENVVSTQEFKENWSEKEILALSHLNSGKYKIQRRTAYIKTHS